MKLRFTFYLIFLLSGIPAVAVAQQLAADTVLYKTEIYRVKEKSEPVADIASKFKTDVGTLSKLNNWLNADSILLKGQEIIVPVYIKPDSNAPNGAGIQNDKNRGSNNETAKANIQVATPALDTELIQNSILLTDATLDLNRTLLQGIEASLDSLNVKDKSIIDEKNISLTIHRMQRQRDRAMLTPVLLHMQDSLKNEIKKEQGEKERFERILGTNPPGQVTEKPKEAEGLPDTGVKVLDSVKTVETPVQIVPPDTETVEIAGHNKFEPPADTVHKRRVIEANPATEPAASQPVMHWETAKAIYYNDDNVSETENKAGPAAETPAIRNAKDTSAYIPGTVAKDSVKTQVPTSAEARIIRAKYYYTLALKAINEKSFNNAVSYLKKAIDLYPKYYDAWLALGETDAHLGLYTKALNELSYCKTIDSSSAILFYKRGLVELKLKDKTKALNDFNTSLKLDHDYIPAIISRAMEYVDKGMYRIAIKEYNRVLQLDPAYHTVYKQKALAEYAVKSYTAAIDDFTRFLIFNETDASVYYHRGMAKLELKQTTDACIDFSFSAKLGYKAAAKALNAHCK